MRLGDLERGVMDVLWEEPGRAFSVREVCAHFAGHAYTTIMTVLTRLQAKGFVVEAKEGRLNTFRAAASREDYVTSLIMEALSSTADRPAALARFVETLPPGDRNQFRRILDRGGR